MFIFLRMFMFSRILIMTLNNWATNWWMLVGTCRKNHLEAPVPSKWPKKLSISARSHPTPHLPVVFYRGAVLPESAGSCPSGLMGGCSETDSTGADRLLPRAAVMMLAAVLRAWLCARCYTDGVSSSHKNPAQYFPHFTDKQTKIGRD